jgi:trk system potassium uptake protein TrkH
MNGRRFKILVKPLVLLSGVVSLAMLVPLAMAAAWGEKELVRAFAFSAAPAILISVPVLLFTKKKQARFSAADGFLLVFLAWIITCVLGAAPYYISRIIPDPADAVFESVSGFTTTGATVLSDPEHTPRSLLFWRAMTHWLGGMGIVVLTVALLPLPGAGGIQLFQAESPGPETEKITPKITATAKILWIMYIVLTAFQSVLLLAGGMNWFDAVVHSFSTMATGGFSSRNDSVAAYHSPFIEWVCVVFMIIAGCNFALLWRLVRPSRSRVLSRGPRARIREFFQNSEVKAYFLIILLSVIVVSVSVYSGSGSSRYRSFGTVIRHAAFQSASILSTTGFSSADYGFWPPLAQACLFFLMFIGGCSGSTAGGVKVIRHVVLAKQMENELKRLMYPRGIFSIRLNGNAGSKHIVYGVAGFVFLYLLLVLAAAFLLSAAGLDMLSSLSGGLLALGNIGLGFGFFGAGASAGLLPASVKWGLSFIMIAGRLELWTALVFFSGEYRRAA